MRILVTLSLLFMVACSSNKDSGPPAGGTNDAGGGNSSSGGSSGGASQPADPIITNIQITGDGRVASGDGTIDCKSDGSTTSGKCSGNIPGETLYASHGYNWSFDHWDPEGSTDSTLYVPIKDTPTTITAVFTDISGTNGSGTEPTDASFGRD